MGYRFVAYALAMLVSVALLAVGGLILALPFAFVAGLAIRHGAPGKPRDEDLNAFGEPAKRQESDLRVGDGKGRRH